MRGGGGHLEEGDGGEGVGYEGVRGVTFQRVRSPSLSTTAATIILESWDTTRSLRPSSPAVRPAPPPAATPPPRPARLRGVLFWPERSSSRRQVSNCDGPAWAQGVRLAGDQVNSDQVIR